MLASAGLALSATSPDGSIFFRTSAISPLNDAMRSTSSLRIGNMVVAFLTAARECSIDSR